MSEREPGSSFGRSRHSRLYNHYGACKSCYFSEVKCSSLGFSSFRRSAKRSGERPFRPAILESQMIYVVTALHVIVCVFLIVVVLLQSGKAADLAGAFGGMGSQTVFGPRGAATVLSKATTAAAALFMISSLTLAILASQGNGRGSGSVLERHANPAPAQPAPAKTQPQQSKPATPAPATPDAGQQPKK